MYEDILWLMEPLGQLEVGRQLHATKAVEGNIQLQDF